MSVRPKLATGFVGFSYREVVAALRSKHLIAETGATSFRGRFQRFQELGFPEKRKAGRGGKIHYGWPEVVQLATALECQELGIQPTRTVVLLTMAESEILDNVARHVADRRELGFLIMRGGGFDKIREKYMALGHKMDETPDFAHYVTRGEIGDKLSSKDSACVIDLDRLIERLYKALAEASSYSKEEMKTGFKKWAMQYKQDHHLEPSTSNKSGS